MSKNNTNYMLAMMPSEASKPSNASKTNEATDKALLTVESRLAEPNLPTNDASSMEAFFRDCLTRKGDPELTPGSK